MGSGRGKNGKCWGRDGAESVEIDVGRSIGAQCRENKAGRRRRREAKAPPVTGALTCLLVVLGILHRLRVGDAFKPAVLALDQERCWEHTGGHRHQWSGQHSSKPLFPILLLGETKHLPHSHEPHTIPKTLMWEQKGAAPYFLPFFFFFFQF